MRKPNAAPSFSIALTDGSETVPLAILVSVGCETPVEATSLGQSPLRA
jgi:hypothetical protein